MGLREDTDDRRGYRSGVPYFGMAVGRDADNYFYGKEETRRSAKQFHWQIIKQPHDNAVRLFFCIRIILLNRAFQPSPPQSPLREPAFQLRRRARLLLRLRPDRL